MYVFVFFVGIKIRQSISSSSYLLSHSLSHTQDRELDEINAALFNINQMSRAVGEEVKGS